MGNDTMASTFDAQVAKMIKDGKMPLIVSIAVDARDFQQAIAGKPNSGYLDIVQASNIPHDKVAGFLYLVAHIMGMSAMTGKTEVVELGIRPLPGSDEAGK